MLTLPDERQRDTYDCGEAAVKCVLKYYQINSSVKFATSVDGSDPRQLEAALRLAGLNVLAGEMTVADLKHFVKQKRPVVCLIWYDTSSTSHYVVVSGFIKNTIYYHDVYSGPECVGINKWNKMWMAMGRMGETYMHWGMAVWNEA